MPQSRRRSSAAHPRTVLTATLLAMLVSCAQWNELVDNVAQHIDPGRREQIVPEPSFDSGAERSRLAVELATEGDRLAALGFADDARVAYQKSLALSGAGGNAAATSGLERLQAENPR